MDNDKQNSISRIEQIATRWQSVLQELEAEMDHISRHVADSPEKTLRQLDILMQKAEHDEEIYVHYPLEDLFNSVDGSNDTQLRGKLDQLREDCSAYFEIFEKKTASLRQQLVNRLNITSKEMQSGIKQPENTFEAEYNDPLLQPIHGISLRDYAAAIYFRTSGIAHEHILAVLGITHTIWNEVHALWNKRMEEDAGLTAITFYSRYYNEAKHNKRFITMNSPNV